MKWSIAVVRPRPYYRPTEKLLVELKAEIDPGWHLYSFPQPPGSAAFPIMIRLPDGQAFDQAGEIEWPKPESAADPNSAYPTEFYEDSALFRVPVRVAPKSRPAKQQLQLQVRYQACNDRLCLPPKTETLETAIEIRGKPK